MYKKFVKTLVSTIIAFCCILLPSTSAFAECSPDVCNKSEYPASVKAACGCDDAGASEPELTQVITNILYAFIAVGGLVAAIFIVIGGYQYMTSTGESAKLKKAKDTILYAVIGLAVCVLAFAIVNWTIGAFDYAPPASSEEEPVTKPNEENSTKPQTE